MDIINEQDVTEIIKKHKKSSINVKNYSIKSLEGTNGFFGQHKILTVHLENGEKCTFFLKIFPEMEPQKTVGEKYGVFTKEINIYKLFSKIIENGFSILETVLPKCYLTKENLLLVFNNLKEDKYEVLNKLEYLNYDLVVFVLKQLAVFHGASLVYEEQQRFKEGKDNYTILDEHASDLKEVFFMDDDQDSIERIKGSLIAIDKAFEIYNLPKVPAELCAKVAFDIFRLVKPSQNFRNVISHGDIWCTNFMIRFNEDNKPMGCKFVDFQFSRYCPPAHDVLSLIYLTTSKEFRKEHMYELLGIYYSHLEKIVGLHGFNLSKIVGFGDFLKSCEEQKAFGVLQACIYFPLILLEEEEMDKLFKQKELVTEALTKDRSIFLTFTQRNDKFHDRFKNAIIDFIELCQNYKGL